MSMERNGPLDPNDHRLIAKIKRGLGDPELSLRDRLVRGVKLFSETTSARVFLRVCNQVGPGARVIGRMRVDNRGSIVIGGGLSVTSAFVPVELVTGQDGRIEIGDDV